MAISVDQNTCIGCGACAATCPAVFAMDENGKSKAVTQEDSGCARAAADGCPVQAIKVE